MTKLGLDLYETSHIKRKYEYLLIKLLTKGRYEWKCSYYAEMDIRLWYDAVIVQKR